MNFYVKKLGLNEMTISKGLGTGQRGRFILISPKESKDFFPGHSIKSEKEIKITIPVICEDENAVSYAQYNWHPGKEFKQSKHAGSDHRFYINQKLFSKDYFRQGDYAVFYKFNYITNSINDEFYKIYKFSEHTEEYDQLELLTKSNHSKQNTYGGLFDNLNFIDTSNIKVEKFQIHTSTKKKYKNPESTCSTSDEFRNLVRGIYNFKCAILGEENTIVIKKDDGKKFTNLEAAHLWPDAWKGPLRPDNAILMSSDLHDQFDRGYFTITDELKIKVHESLKDKQIFRLNGKIISTPEDFKPNKKYLKIHQKFVFGRMKPISREKPKGLQKFFENNNYLF